MQTELEGARSDRVPLRITLPAVLLRLEGATLLALAIFLYWYIGASWWLFVIMLLAPDLSMLGYLGGPRLGAITYDMAHAYPLAAALGVIGILGNQSLLIALALIWFAHIGMDRMLGFGLKYTSSFTHTHFDRI